MDLVSPHARPDFGRGNDNVDAAAAADTDANVCLPFWNDAETCLFFHVLIELPFLLYTVLCTVVSLKGTFLCARLYFGLKRKLGDDDVTDRLSLFPSSFPSLLTSLPRAYHHHPKGTKEEEEDEDERRESSFVHQQQHTPRLDLTRSLLEKEVRGWAKSDRATSPLHLLDGSFKWLKRNKSLKGATRNHLNSAFILRVCMCVCVCVCVSVERSQSERSKTNP